MKLKSCDLFIQPSDVAPLVGAWIETSVYVVPLIKGWMSLPSWERGLKLGSAAQDIKMELVAPLVGAWIETRLIRTGNCGNNRRSPRGSVD